MGLHSNNETTVLQTKTTSILKTIDLIIACDIIASFCIFSLLK